MTLAAGKALLWLAEETADLEFDVSSVPDPCRFDSQSHGIEHWKKVDFVFHWPAERELWLVEVKDPDNPFAQGDPTFQIAGFTNKTLIGKNLAPKAKDSFLYLFLEDRIPPDTRVTYFVLFACEQLPAKKRAKYYRAANDELRRKLGLRGPLGRDWAKRDLYIQDCLILSLSEWNHHLGGRVGVRRVSAEITR